MESFNQEALSKRMALALTNYLDQSYSHSFSRLKSLTGLDYKSLKKISMAEMNFKNLNALKLARLAKIILGCGEIEFLNHYKDEVNHSFVPQQNRIRNEVKISDPIELQIYNMCKNQSGCLAEHIRDYLGFTGIKYLESLLEKGLVVKSVDHYRANPNIKISKNDCGKQIENFGRQYKEAKPQFLKNGVFYGHASLNRKGIEELKKLFHEYKQLAQEVLNDSLYQGNNHYEVVIGFDSVIPKEYFSPMVLH
jgi:hypothetical protein